jgi:hypothetical protein
MPCRLVNGDRPRRPLAQDPRSAKQIREEGQKQSLHIPPLLRIAPYPASSSLLPTHLRHPTNSFANSPFSHFCQIFLSQYSVRTVLSVVRPVNFESHDLPSRTYNKRNTYPHQSTSPITFSSNLQEVRLILLLACADPVLLDLLTLPPHISSHLHSFSALCGVLFCLDVSFFA